MATIHITELQQYLAEKGGKDALPNQENGEGYFFEIRFDNDKFVASNIIDQEYRNKIITVDCPYGNVTIVFDDNGSLQSLDIS